MASFLGAEPKIYVAGEEGSPLSSVTGKPVRIQDIRAEYNKDRLWEDADFPATAASIGPIRGDPARGIQGEADLPSPESLLWLRPHEICEIERKTRGPAFGGPFFAAAIEGQSAKKCSEFDIKQGSCLGDCWLMVGLEALTTKPEILNFVIPEDNFSGFDDDKYCGAFHFRFYDMAEGEWVDMVVDDRLPWQPDVKEPAFAKLYPPACTRQAEFWVALVEKAYAKFIGTYAGINGGQTQQGLENFSNGFGEYVPLKDPGTFNLGGDGAATTNPTETIIKFIRAYIKSGFLGVGSYGNPHDKEYTEEVAAGYGDAPGLGLKPGHAYSILDVQEVEYGAEAQASGLEGSKTLVQLKNPWAHAEWQGPFGDKDDFNWGLLVKDLRIEVGGGRKDIDEGVFWMDIEDVIFFFKGLMICHFGLMDGTRLATRKGIWEPELQNLRGIFDLEGKPLGPETRTHFKAYKFEVKQGGAAEKYSDKTGGQAIVLFTVVLHKYTSIYQPGVIFGAELFGPLDSPDQPLAELYKKKPVLLAGAVAREASGWAFVTPGHYVIVPMLVAGEFPIPGRNPIFIPPKDFAGKEIGYTLRVFTENETEIEELKFPGA